MIFSKMRMKYGGDDPDKIIEGYCYKCKTIHQLPAKNWIVELRGNKIKLMCAQKIKYFTLINK